MVATEAASKDTTTTGAEDTIRMTEECSIKTTSIKAVGSR